MKKVIARTRKAFDSKLKEIDRLFKKLNPHFQRDNMVGILQTSGIRRFPKKYPAGVELVLKKKCPYCLEQKEYLRMNWGLDSGSRINHISWDFNGLAAEREFERLNTGICKDCISTHHYGKGNHSPGSSNNRKADTGGFWENLFS